jgi:hypothetical protein
MLMNKTRSLLRSAKFLPQNRAILRNPVRIEIAETPSVSNAAQACENVRKNPGLNYKSAALDQLSYAGVPQTKAVFSELIKSSS